MSKRTRGEIKNPCREWRETYRSILNKYSHSTYLRKADSQVDFCYSPFWHNNLWNLINKPSGRKGFQYFSRLESVFGRDVFSQDKNSVGIFFHFWKINPFKLSSSSRSMGLTHIQILVYTHKVNLLKNNSHRDKTKQHAHHKRNEN